MDEPKTGELMTAQHLPPDLLLLKMEGENMMSLAAARPRDDRQIIENLKAGLDAFPQAASGAIYAKPVGREPAKCTNCGREFQGKGPKKCPDCKTETVVAGQMKFARGLSIRAAETIASIMMYNRVATYITRVDETHVKVQASYTDYASGRMAIDESIVSQYYTSRFGKTTKWADDRFWNVVVKAEKSKVKRDVILFCTPAGIKAAFTDYCEKVMDELLDDATEEKIVVNFGNKGIELAALEEIVGRPRKLGWTKADRKHLATVWNALESEETTVAEIRGDLDDSKKPASGAISGPVEGGDIADPKGKPEPPRPEKAAEKPKEENGEPAAENEKETESNGLPPWMADLVAQIGRKKQVATVKKLLDECLADITIEEEYKAVLREHADQRLAELSEA